MERPKLPLWLPADIEERKDRARRWFEALRDRLCAEFERLEDEGDGSAPPGRFERTSWEA